MHRPLLSIASFVLLLGTVDSAWAAEIPAFSTSPGKPVPPPWLVVGMPDRFNKPLTQFELADIDGQHALKVHADKSWGTLVHTVSDSVKPNTLLRWRWRLDQPLPKSDIHAKATEDSALKICLSFAMPEDNIPAGERTMFKFVKFMTREKIPSATLCYIWGGKEVIGYEQASLFTARVRFVVIANETTPLKTWASKERNVYADFLKAFGQEASVVPALIAITIGADADNTQGSSLGYVGDVQLINPTQ